jgi:hypothetical protein
VAPSSFLSRVEHRAETFCVPVQSCACLDVNGTISRVGCHLCTNDFESEVICQPIVRWQLIIILFTSSTVKHCKSKRQKMLCRVKVGSLRWYGHLSNLLCGKSAARTLKQRTLHDDFRRRQSCYAGNAPSLARTSSRLVGNSRTLVAPRAIKVTERGPPMTEI